jgi:hypothetical protein
VSRCRGDQTEGGRTEGRKEEMKEGRTEEMKEGRTEERKKERK